MLAGGVFEHNSFSHTTIENGDRHPHTYPIYVNIDKSSPEYDYGQIWNIILEVFISKYLVRF